MPSPTNSAVAGTRFAVLPGWVRAKAGCVRADVTNARRLACTGRQGDGRATRRSRLSQAAAYTITRSAEAQHRTRPMPASGGRADECIAQGGQFGATSGQRAQCQKANIGIHILGDNSSLDRSPTADLPEPGTRKVLLEGRSKYAD